MELHPKQREKLANLFLDLSKILVATFVLGPFLAIKEKPINFLLVGIGLLCATISCVIGLALSRPREEK